MLLTNLTVLFWALLILQCSVRVQTVDPKSFQMPLPEFQAFDKNGMNISIPDQEGIKQFSIYASVNREYRGTNQSEKDIIQSTKEKWDNKWIIQVQNKQFELGFGIYFMYFVRLNDVGFIKDDVRTIIDAIYFHNGTVKEKEESDDDSNCARSLTRRLEKNPCRGKLIFSDDFDGPKLAGQRWQYEKVIAQDPDFEFVTYDEDNARFVNGKLMIQPKAIQNKTFLQYGTVNFDQDCTKPRRYPGCKRTASPHQILPPINSSRIISTPQFTFIYGKIEFRAKLPEGDWIYPQLFLARKNIDSLEPESVQRIVMAFSADDRTRKNHLRFGYIKQKYDQKPEFVELQYNKTNLESRAEWNKKYHIFQILWEPDRIEFFVDSESYGSMRVRTTNQKISTSDLSSTRSFDDQFYFEFGVGVGGRTFFSEDSRNGHYSKPWENRDSKAVDKFSEKKREWLPSWKKCSIHELPSVIKTEELCPTALVLDNIKVWAL